MGPQRFRCDGAHTDSIIRLMILMSSYLYTKKYTAGFPETCAKVIHRTVHKENLNNAQEERLKKSQFFLNAIKLKDQESIYSENLRHFPQISPGSIMDTNHLK